MSIVTPGFLFSLLTAIVVIAGDVVIKHAADASRPILSLPVILGCALYAGSALAWYGAMRHLDLGQGGVVYSMFSLLALCALGAALFQEEFGLRDGLGVLCALAALGFMAHQS
ncbi:MAG: hypothetical protein AAGB18_04840 [Pseudomonadota bacterium]